MNSHRRYAYLKVTLVGAVLLLFWNCGSGPTQVDVEGENDPPDTFVTQKSLAKVPLETDSTGAVLNLNLFTYTIQYTATDVDGIADSFQVKINDGPWSSFTTRTSNSDTLEFTSQATVNTVFVRAKDDQGDLDPTPAEASFSLREIEGNSLPTTAIDSGPPNGSQAGRGVTFVLNGADEDGHVTNFIYSLDGAAEITVAADADGKAAVEFSLAMNNLLPEGAHTFSVRSVDNLGAEDLTPETRSFLVAAGFAPILTQADGPPPGGGWFTGASIPFAWNTKTDHYSGVILRFEFSVDDPVNFIETSESSIALDPLSAGPHTFRVRAVDTEGNISEPIEVTFDVAAFTPTEGILFIDNMSFVPSSAAYDSEPDIDQKVLDGFFKNFSQVSVWDVDRFGGGGSRFPGAINDTELPGPSDLARFSSVVIMTDGGYSVDNISALLAAYFQAGGNLMITGYRSTDFGQVLKDVMGTPTVFNGFGTDFQSLEGFSETSGNNSGDYAFISGADVVPVIPGAGPRTWEVTTNVAGSSLRVMFANVGADGAFGGFRIATETQGEKGNYGLWIGVSMGYLDQTSTGITKLGDFVLGERFGETKN